MDTSTISTPILWTGRILKILICLFFLFDAIMKVVKSKGSIEATTQLGLPESSVQFLGMCLLTATLLFALPKTSFYGILLIVAYLGGAVAIMYASKPDSFAWLFPLVCAVLSVVAEYLQNQTFRSFFKL